MKVENTTEHDIMINGKAADGSAVTVTVPAASGSGNLKVNGSADVDDKLLAALRAGDKVVAAWFEDGDLVEGGKRVTVTDKGAGADKGSGK